MMCNWIFWMECVFLQGISRIRIEPEYTKGVLQKIKSKTFSEDVFDVVQARVGSLEMLRSCQ